MPGGELYKENDGRTAHQRDWDFIVETRDRILKEKGLLNSSDAYKKMQALADYVQSARGREGERYPSRHPSDYILHSSYCTGAANTEAAFAATLGLKYRTLNTYAHSTAEVEISGKWHFLDDQSPLPGLLR